MNNRFTSDAKKVLRYAQESAKSFRHDYVGTEHILLGLVLHTDSMAGQFLAQQGLTSEHVTRAIQNAVGVGEKATSALRLTPRTKRTMELAVRTANQLGQQYISTEHMLAGVLQEQGCMARRILEQMDVNPDELLQKIVQLMNNGAAGGEAEGQAIDLSEFGRDLNELAREDKIDPVIGRSREIERVVQILCRRTKNNPVLIGEPGVGKTAIAEGLAQRIVTGDVPDVLAHKRIFSLDMGSLVAGTKYRGEFEDRIKQVIEAVQQDDDMILFIDELHQLIGAGAVEGSMDAANILKPALSRGELQCIGATTIDEYKKNLEKDAALASEEFERCASLRDEGKKIADEIAALKQEKKRHDDAKLIVTEEDVADVVSQWTGVPVQQLTETEARRLLHLEEELHKRVISQDEAVTAVAKAIRRVRAGLKDVNRPIGSFLFLGPSGVGKTELARTLARQLFGSQDAMIRIDMSEFMERYSVSRLVGAPPGYVGYEEGGELTDAVREKPYSVVLFDEVEKASGDFFNLLLQVLDEGRLTDSKGRTVDFRNTVIIMTSNLGASHLKPSAPVMGFAAGTGTDKDKAASFAIAKKEILDDVKKFFRPEFLNRIDEMLVFKPLETEDLRRIVALMLEDLGRRLQEKGVQMTWTTEADDVLVQEGTDFAYGARPLKRAIQKLVEDPIAEMLLGGSLKEGNVLQVDSLDKKELVFTTT